MDNMRDNRSELTKSFGRIALEITAPIREASDCAHMASPELVRRVQVIAERVLAEVYFGTRPELESR